MIWLLNRREVFMGLNMDGFARTKERLAAAGIPCACRISSSGGFGADRSHGGMLPRGNPAPVYYIYVHKKDYDRAAACIGVPGKMP